MIDFARKSNENSPVSGAVHDAFARSVKVVERDEPESNILHIVENLMAGQVLVLLCLMRRKPSWGAAAPCVSAIAPYPRDALATEEMK
jgi:hypothetical protein